MVDKEKKESVSFRSHNGPYRTRSLFYEEYQAEPDFIPLYTLKDEDLTVGDVVYPSIKKAYLEMEDFTEYEFAKKYFESFLHWERISNCNWFQKHIEQWRKELALKVKARALEHLKQEAAKPEGKFAYEANKYLVSEGWVDKKAKESKRGRPTKEEVKTEAERLGELEKTLQEDLKRTITQKELN